MFGDSFFKKVENKTGVDKDAIMSLANKIQGSNMKDENVIRDLIMDVSKVAGKEVDEAKIQKIVSTIQNDKVPKDLDKML